MQGGIKAVILRGVLFVAVVAAVSPHVPPQAAVAGGFDGGAALIGSWRQLAGASRRGGALFRVQRKTGCGTGAVVAGGDSESGGASLLGCLARVDAGAWGVLRLRGAGGVESKGSPGHTEAGGAAGSGGGDFSRGLCIWSAGKDRACRPE